MTLIINIVGALIAYLPRCAIALICNFVGYFFFVAFRRRRAVLISNFEKAFPKKTREECKLIALESAQRMVELGLLSVVLPFWSEEKIRRSFKVDDSLAEFINQTENKPAIVLLPHFSQMEAMTVLPLIDARLREREIGVIYRPFKNLGLERWVKKTRSRFGLTLIPRGTKGLLRAKDILSRNGVVVMLFDQNARNAGVLTDFMGRVASTTRLPNLLYKHFRCPVYMMYPQRTGVFQAMCIFERLSLAHDENPDNTDNITVAMNRWLEKKLQKDRQSCCDWLWVHNRWRVCDDPSALSKFRSIVDESKLTSMNR